LLLCCWAWTKVCILWIVLEGGGQYNYRVYKFKYTVNLPICFNISGGKSAPVSDLI
jgi:hypothetical protein